MAVGLDHLIRAARFEEMNRLQRPVHTTILSWQNLAELPNAVGATWLLDRQLVAKASEPAATSGIGSEVGGPSGAAPMERREVAKVGARIASETGLGSKEISPGDRLIGIYQRTLMLNSGRFALIERARDFSLVSWRAALESTRGQSVTGIVGGEGIYRGRSGSSAG